MYIVVNINLVDVFIYDTSWSTLLLSLYYTYNCTAIYSFIYTIYLYNYLYNIILIIYTIYYYNKMKDMELKFKKFILFVKHFIYLCRLCTYNNTLKS